MHITVFRARLRFSHASSACIYNWLKELSRETKIKWSFNEKRGNLKPKWRSKDRKCASQDDGLCGINIRTN